MTSEEDVLEDNNGNGTELLGNFNQSDNERSGSIGLTKTQLMVISTCSTVIGIFFILAAIMRIRSYIKRYRGHYALNSRPPFCSVTFRSTETSSANNNESAKQILEDDAREMNKNVSSVPRSQSALADITEGIEDIRTEEHKSERGSIAQSDTRKLTIDVEDYKENIATPEERAETHPQKTDTDSVESFVLPLLKNQQIYHPALCLTQSDTSVTSSEEYNPSYSYGNQREHSCDLNIVCVECCHKNIRKNNNNNINSMFLSLPSSTVHFPFLVRQNSIDDLDEYNCSTPVLSVPAGINRNMDMFSNSSSNDSLDNDDYLESSSDEMYPLYNKESISEKLNEMCDDLFDDMLMDDRANIADFNEFDNLILMLPTIPEGSVEYTDSDQDNRPHSAGPSWPNSDQCKNKSHSILKNQLYSEIVNNNAESQPLTADLSQGVTGDQNPGYVRSSSDDSDNDDNNDSSETNQVSEERTLLLRSFERMESTLV